MTTTLETAINTIREARAAIADATAALADAPAYIGRAITYSGTRPADLARIEQAIPFCPTVEPLPESLTPHTCYSTAGLTYALPRDGWRERLAGLRARHPAIPLAIVKDGSTAIRPAARPAPERASVEHVADYAIAVRPVADYPVVVVIEWYTEPAPGVVLRIHAEAGAMSGPDAWHPLCARVRYTLDNPPRSERTRQHPEDRRWSCAWTWGPGSRSIRWWSSPGERSPMTWTWPAGTTLEHAIGEDK